MHDNLNNLGGAKSRQFEPQGFLLGVEKGPQISPFYAPCEIAFRIGYTMLLATLRPLEVAQNDSKKLTFSIRKSSLRKVA